MRVPKYLVLLALCSSLSYAQMPASFDASGKGAQNNNGNSPQSNQSSANEEPSNPEFFGMEIPMLDPSNDTVRYNGSSFDVGNNALVRARFEKYLQQLPDNGAEAKRYRARMKAILELTRKSGQSKFLVSSDTLVKIGRGLYDIADYDADGGQADVLASAIVSVLDAQRANMRRDLDNEASEAEIDKLIKDSNKRTNRNTDRVEGTTGENGPTRNAGKPERDTTLIQKNTKDIVELEAEQKKNDATNLAAITFSKITYQSMLVSLLMQRRFDHTIIGARIYRHLFNEGDTRMKMNQDSKASKFFSDIGGMPPTINTMDSLASSAKRDVDQSMQAVAALIAQNKTGAATQQLIQAVAIGEFMDSVTTFPSESRNVIAKYWTLRKRVLTSLNARDYATTEATAAEMKKMDEDFDDSMLLSYCSGKKRQSDLYLRNAMKAELAGDEEKFHENITQAGIIWPLNPNLEEGEKKLKEMDEKEPEKQEFKKLLARKDYRTIYDEQERFEIVAIDPEMKQDYKDVLTLVATMDAMLEQLAEVAKQDKRMGPCAAYETLMEKQEEEPRFKEDSEYQKATYEYKSQAQDFVQAISDAQDCEKRNEYGSALSNYYRALTIYPSSKLANAGATKIKSIIMGADY